MGRNVLRGLLFTIGVGLPTCLPSLAHAGEPMAASLVYAADDPSGACASEAEFRRKVAIRLGYDPFEASAAWLFRVRIDARRTRPSAAIVTERDGKPAGKRELDEATCEALSETVASTVAIAIDPVAASPAPEAPPPAEAPAPPPLALPEAPARSTSPPPAPEAPPADRASVVPLVYLDGTAALGRTAGVAGGGRAGVGIGYRGLSLAGEARGETTPDAVKLTAIDSAYWSVFSGALVTCGHKGLFEVCGVGALGSLQAKARDVTRPSLKSTLFASLGARVGVAVPLTADIALRGNVELGIPLVRTTFFIDGQPAWTAPAANGTVSLGVSARFR